MILLDFVGPSLKTVADAAKWPQIAPYIIKKYIQAKEHAMSHTSHLLVSLLSTYRPVSYLTPFYYQWIMMAPAWQPIFMPPIIYQLDRVYKCIVARDISGITEHLGNRNLIKPRVQLIIAMHIITDLGYADLLEHLVIRANPAKGWNLKWILRNVLILGQFDVAWPVLEPMYSFMKDGKLGHHMDKILDGAIYAADIFLIHRISQSWPHVLHQMNQRHSVFARLADRTFAGNLQNLLIFMELHPNKLRLAENAWKIIIDPKTNDLFLNLFT